MIEMTVENQNSGCEFLNDAIFKLHLAIIQLKFRRQESKEKKSKAKKRSFVDKELQHFEKRLNRLKLLKEVLMQKKS